MVRGEGARTVSDIVVTVPKNFKWGDKRGLAAWLSEGDAPGDVWDGELYDFSTWGFCPEIRHGERVYVCCEGMIVGYAPLVEMDFNGDTVVAMTEQGPLFAPVRGCMARIHLIRGGGAVAVTIPEKVIGFRGWRYRWWEYEVEQPIDLSRWMDVRLYEGTP